MAAKPHTEAINSVGITLSMWLSKQWLFTVKHWHARVLIDDLIYFHTSKSIYSSKDNEPPKNLILENIFDCETSYNHVVAYSTCHTEESPKHIKSQKKS